MTTPTLAQRRTRIRTRMAREMSAQLRRHRKTVVRRSSTPTPRRTTARTATPRLTTKTTRLTKITKIRALSSSKTRAFVRRQSMSHPCPSEPPVLLTSPRAGHRRKREDRPQSVKLPLCKTNLERLCIGTTKRTVWVQKRLLSSLKPQMKYDLKVNLMVKSFMLLW